MPYIHQTWTGEAARKKAARYPFGMGLDEEIAERVELLKLECSSFSDPGSDWEKWHAYDADGEEIATRRVNAY